MQRAKAVPDREPDFEGSGFLAGSAGRQYPVIGQVWLPRGFGQQPLVQLLLPHIVSSGPHELNLEVEQQNKTVVKVIGYDVWLPEQSQRRHAKPGAADSYRATAEPKTLRIVRPWGVTTSDSPLT